MLRWLRIATVLTLSLVATVRADEYATLTGRFVFDGDAPQVRELRVDKDERTCGKVLEERLLVHPKNRGIANVVVQLYLAPKQKPPVHPRLEELRQAEAAITYEGCCIRPHVNMLMTEQRVRLINKDPVGHVVAIQYQANPPPSDIIPGSNRDIVKIHKLTEKLPVKIHCYIHPWMSGYLIITDHPYVAVSDESGNFTISDLPPGEYTFRVWHERSGFIEDVEREGKSKKWTKGRFTVDLTPTTHSLGEIKVPASEFPAEK